MENLQLKKDIYIVFLDKFSTAVNSGYLRFPEQIGNVLEWIVINPSLANFIEESMKGIDYEEELAKCIGNNVSGIKLPIDDNKKIAIVFGLLYQININYSLLTELFTAYYSSESYEDAFNRFVIEVLKRFIKAVRDNYIAYDDSDVVIDNVNQKYNYVSDAFDCILDISGEIQNDNSISLQEGSRINDYLFTLRNAIENKDIKAINTAFFAVNNVLGKKCRNNVMKLEAIIKQLIG